MKITKVTTQWLRIPLPNPVGWSIKTLTHREHLLVRIESDAGAYRLSPSLNFTK